MSPAGRYRNRATLSNDVGRRAVPEGTPDSFTTLTQGLRRGYDCDALRAESAAGME